MPTLRDVAIAVAVTIISLALITVFGYLGGFITTLLVVGAVAYFLGKDENVRRGASSGHPVVGALALLAITYLIALALTRNGIAAALIAVITVLAIALLRRRGRRAQQLTSPYA